MPNNHFTTPQGSPAAITIILLKLRESHKTQHKAVYDNSMPMLSKKSWIVKHDYIMQIQYIYAFWTIYHCSASPRKSPRTMQCNDFSPLEQEEIPGGLQSYLDFIRNCPYIF